MCHPAVMIGFGVLQAGAQYFGQQSQANATYKYQLEKQALTIASAADAARHEYQGIADRTSQVRAQASQDIQNASLGYKKAVSAGTVTAAGGGIMGATVEEGKQNFAMRYEDYHASRELNLSWHEKDLIARAEGIEAKHRGRHEGTMFAPVEQANPLAALAQAGSSVFSAYSAFPEHAMFEGWAT